MEQYNVDNANIDRSVLISPATTYPRHMYAYNGTPLYMVTFEHGTRYIIDEDTGNALENCYLMVVKHSDGRIVSYLFSLEDLPRAYWGQAVGSTTVWGTFGRGWAEAEINGITVYYDYHVDIDPSVYDLSGFIINEVSYETGDGNGADLCYLLTQGNEETDPIPVSIPVQWRSTTYGKTYQDNFNIYVHK